MLMISGTMHISQGPTYEIEGISFGNKITYSISQGRKVMPKNIRKKDFRSI